MIDPTNQVVKTITPDEESATIDVAAVDLGFVGGITVSPNPMVSKEEGTESVTVKDFGAGSTGGPFAIQLNRKRKASRRRR